MRLGLPFDALHEAIAAACHRDLPDIDYLERDWTALNKLKQEEREKVMYTIDCPGTIKKRRPTADDGIEVIMFPQTWSSTATGYGGIGGAAMTDAYTIIVSYHNDYCVYFGCGRLAYKFDIGQISTKSLEKFRNDIKEQQMEPVSRSYLYKEKFVKPVYIDDTNGN